MTTTFRNNAEGGSNGTALTTSDTTGGDAFTLVNHPGSGTITYSTEQAAHGTLSYKLVSTASNACQVGVSGFTADNMAHRWLVYVTSLPGAFELFRLYAGASKKVVLQLKSTGELQVKNAADSVVKTFDNDFPLAQWVRVEVVAVKGTTSSNGTIKVRYAPLDSDTITDEYTAVGTANTGTDQFTQPWIGDTGGSGFATTMYVDDIAFDVQDTYIGRVETLPAAVDTAQVYAVTSNDGGWTATGAADIPTALADPDDTDSYIAVGSGAIVLRSAPLTAPPARIVVPAKTTVAGGTIKIEAMQGATVRATLDTISLTTSVATYTLAISDVERAGFSTETDGSVTDLDVRVTAG